MRSKVAFGVALALCLANGACGDDSPSGGNGTGGDQQGGGGSGDGGSSVDGGSPEGGSGDGGEGVGGAGGQPGAATAASCEASDECGGELCLTETDWGFADGYCSQLCAPDIGVTCGASDVCVDTGGGYSVCLKECADAGDCTGPGQDCVPVATGPDNEPITGCVGGCDSDAECAVACNNDSNLCSNAEVCDNGVDEDGDGLHDCQELDCISETVCTTAIGAACTASVALTSGVPATGDTATGTDLFYGLCAGFFGDFATGLAKESTFSYTATATGVLTVTGTAVAGDFGLYARTTCADGATQIACADDAFGVGEDEVIEINVATGDVVTIFVDAYDSTLEGDFEVVADFVEQVCGDGEITGSEGCDDNNTAVGDGCDASCQVELDFYCNAAAVIALGTTTGDTSTGTAVFEAPVDAAECTFGAGGAGGSELIYTYTPATTGNLTIELTSTSDEDFGLYARTDCESGATQIGCSDVNFNPGMNDEELTIPVTANVPVTIFVDAYGGPGGAFSVTLTQ